MREALQSARSSEFDLSWSCFRLHRILTQGEIRPHKIRYYVKRLDPESSQRWLKFDVYKEVEIVNAGLLEGTLKEPSVVS